MRRTPLLTQTAILATAGLLVLSNAARADKPVERFTAFAVDMSAQARPGARTGTVDITINRWSTPEERRRLEDALRENGPDGLLKALQDVKDDVGNVSTPGNLGYPLRFAYEAGKPGGARRILLATDRRIGYFEAINQPITTDYPFMVIDLTIGADGKGQGRLLPLARVTANDDHVVDVENYTTEPVRLTEVREVK
jgi:hypothetical protein